MAVFQDIPEETITKLSDRKVLDEQARFNTRRLNFIQRLFDDPTATTARQYYEHTKKEYQKLLEASREPEEKEDIQEKIEICNAGIENLEVEEMVDEVLGELLEHLQQEHQFRKSRSRKLVRRRNELIEIEKEAQRKELEEQRKKIEKDFSVVDMEVRRVDIVGVLADFIKDSQITARKLRSSGHSGYASKMETLARTSFVAMDLLKKVDLNPKDE